MSSFWFAALPWLGTLNLFLFVEGNILMCLGNFVHTLTTSIVLKLLLSMTGNRWPCSHSSVVLQVSVVVYS